MTVPWEERGTTGAVAVGQVEIRCLLGCSGKGVAGGAPGPEASAGMAQVRGCLEVAAWQRLGQKHSHSAQCSGTETLRV